MIGSIHSDQRCSVCQGIFKDNGKDGLCCDLHPEQKATRFKVRFGRVTKRFKDYHTALTFLSHLRVERAQGTFDYRKYQVESPLRFSITAEQFMALKEKSCRVSTLRKYWQYYTICCGYFSDTLLPHIGHKELQLFIYSLECSTYRVKCILDWMMELLQWCYDNGDLTRVPKRPAWKWSIGTRPIIDKDTQAIIIGEVYNSFPKRCGVAIELLSTYPKIRPSELRQVKEAHINLKKGTITIPSPKESREPKVITLIPEHIELLQSLPRGMPHMYFLRYDYPTKGRRVGDRFGKDYLYHVWRKTTKRLGIKVDLYRGTKHSTITDWSRRHPLALIQKASNVTKSIERYIQLNDRDVEQLYREAAPDNRLTTDFYSHRT